MTTDTIEIPNSTISDTIFGNTDHLPPYDKIPDEFKPMFSDNINCRAASCWFFKGISSKTLKIKPQFEGKRAQALGAIKSILSSFEPKHEHKMAGVAYLISQWFDIDEKSLKTDEHM